MNVIDQTSDYEVADGLVTLTVVIGNAQIGSSVATLDTEEKGPCTHGGAWNQGRTRASERCASPRGQAST